MGYTTGDALNKHLAAMNLHRTCFASVVMVNTCIWQVLYTTKYYNTTKTKQNRSSVATVSSAHAGASLELWYQRYLRTLQGPGPTKPTTFLGHRSPDQKRAIKELGGTSSTSFCL